MTKKKKLYLAEKLKLDDGKIREYISSWSYETIDQDGNPIVKQKKKQSYTPLVALEWHFLFPKGLSRWYLTSYERYT